MSRTQTRLAAFVSALAMLLAVAPAAPAAPVTPKLATARVTACVSDATFAGRKLEFKGRMRDINANGPMQMRFDVHKRIPGKRFKRLSGTGLGTWIESTEPDATIFSRTVSLGGAIETKADYRAKVRFRWIDSQGGTVIVATRTTRICHQKKELPDIVVRSVSSYPGAPPWAKTPGFDTTYVVTVYNKGGSSATSFGSVQMLIGGQLAEAQPAPAVPVYDLILAKTTYAYFLNGPACVPGYIATYQAGTDFREKNLKNNTLSVNRC